MACDAQSLITAAAAQKFFALSERDLKMATLYSLCASHGVLMSAQTLITGAMAQGYDKLSDRDLMEAILVVACGGP